MDRSLLKTLVALLLMGLMQVSYAVKVDKIVAFGDSLSDNGNVYTFTKRAHSVIPRVPIIPAEPPYYKGRFSNGENWLDDLAKDTGLPLLVHAYGGTWAEPLWDSGLPFGIGAQIGLYILENAFDRHKDQHLFTIWSGANDYLNGREDVDFATTNTVNNIKSQIERLIYHGAHQLLIVSLPDISRTPEVVEKGPRIVEQTRALVNEHNRKLAIAVKEVQEANQKVIIVYVDAREPFDQLMTNPSAFHLKNVDKACYGGGFYLNVNMVDPREITAAKDAGIDIMNNPSLRVAYMTANLPVSGNQVCANPDEYLFWDHIHPTRVIHHVIATLAELELKTHNIQWEKK